MRADRRTLLLGIGGLSAVAVGGLAGCSSGAGSQSARTTAPPAGGPGSAGAAPPGALALTSEVPVGGGTIIPAERMVITQPSAGQFVGLSGICTHQGCMVSQIRGASIICGCHGSQFALDGAVQKGPAKKPLEKLPVTVRGDALVKG